VVQPITAIMQRVPLAAEAPFSLFVFAPHHAYCKRAQLTCRIIIVGASTTALAALRGLALSKSYDTPYVTLLAPGGVSAAHALADPRLAAVVNDGSVMVLEAALVSIDRCDSCPRP
jgi:hypothetical protein